MIQDILWSTYTQLGCKAYAQGNHSFAQRMFVQAMEEAERNRQNQRRIATSMANLALVYYKQHDMKIACRLFKKALALYEQLYGKINSSTTKNSYRRRSQYVCKHSGATRF